MQSFLSWPYFCLFCHSRSDQQRDLCSYCQQALVSPINKCIQCGLALELTYDKHCGRCLKNPPMFDRVIAAMDYSQESAYLLHRFKFHQDFACGRVLANLMEEALLKVYHSNEWPELLIPVPLHYKRLYKRGFNQALSLARHLQLPIRLDYGLIKRIRHTPCQVGLSGQWRKRNLTGAFKVTKNVADKHIAILDDAITSGSTSQCIARELKLAGTKQVDVWCAIRTQKKT